MNARLAVGLLAGTLGCLAWADDRGDTQWDFRLGRPALDGGALAAVWHHGELYVGGNFKAAGASFAPGVARWDGTNWHPVGEGLSNSNAILPVVTSLANWKNALYAGGNFVRSGDTWVPGLARWNGTNWSALPGIAAARVNQLVADDGGLFVAGNLRFTGDTNAYGIAHWDGSSWQTHDSRIRADDSVGCIAVRDGTVFISGSFSAIADTPVSHNAYWNGVVWQALPGLTNQTFRALVIHAGELYGSGSFTRIGGVAANNLARWDGENWWPVGDGFDQAPDDLFSTADSFFAVGNFKQSGNTPMRGVARWDGATWQSIDADAWPESGPQRPAHLCLTDDGRLFAVGYFFSVHGQRAGHVAEWNGTQWQPVAVTNSLVLTDEFLSIFSMAADEQALFVGGVYFEPFGASGRAVWQLKSNTWTKLGGDFTNVGGSPVIWSLVVQNGQLFAAGGFTHAGGATVHNLARWDGNQWQAVGDITNGAIGAMTSDGTNLFVGDTDDPPLPTANAHVKQWDGHQWTVLGGELKGQIGSLAWADGNLYVGGAFTNVDGQAANRIAVWKNGQWANLGSGVDGAIGATVTAIVVDGTNVFAGGRFSTAGGVAVNNLARWDGTQWHPVGTPPHDGVLASATAIMAMIMRDGQLYVGGFFTSAGGQDIAALARFDGTNWSRLGSGPRHWGIGAAPQVRALAWQDNALWVGGLFPAAGNQAPASLARWVAQPSIRLAAPNPIGNQSWQIRANGVAGLRFTLQTSTNLQEWVDLTNGEGGTDTWEFLDAQSYPTDQRYYRSVLRP